DPGDQVYIFGFSRGAFTARSLAGLIYRCGLLRCDHTDKQCDHADKIEQAYNLYRTHFERRKARGSCENESERSRISGSRTPTRATSDSSAPSTPCSR